MNLQRLAKEYLHEEGHIMDGDGTVAALSRMQYAYDYWKLGILNSSPNPRQRIENNADLQAVRACYGKELKGYLEEQNTIGMSIFLLNHKGATEADYAKATRTDNIRDHSSLQDEIHAITEEMKTVNCPPEAASNTISWTHRPHNASSGRQRS